MIYILKIQFRCHLAVLLEGSQKEIHQDVHQNVFPLGMVPIQSILNSLTPQGPGFFPFHTLLLL